MKPVREKSKFLVFGSPLIEEAEIEEVISCLRSSWIGTGPRVQSFESEIAKYKGVQEVAALNSCTAALHLSLLACNLKPGDEVITTPLTFCATVNAIIHSGATPVLADIDEKTLNIDPEEIRKKITTKTKAIVPVHFAGRPCDMDSIMGIAGEYDLKVIEDCAHAIESMYKGRHAGTFGDFGCFSFYSTKNVVTGEGGAVITKNANDMARVRILGLHGMSKDAWKRFGDDGFKHYQVVECGYKYNMMDLQAALGIHQIRRVDDYWIKRAHVWNRYNQELSMAGIALPSDVPNYMRHAYHLYTIILDGANGGVTRDVFLNRMTAQGIGVGVHYMSVPEHPYYRNKFGWNPEDYPIAMKVGRGIVSLPISAKLSDGDISDVIEAVKRSMA